jgi:asparagine synthetase B (glutamine-hydrolysing)
MLERFLGARGLGPFERHVAWFGTATPEESRRLLSPELRAAVPSTAPTAHLTELIARLREGRVISPGRPFPLLAYQLLDFETYLSGDLLTKVDRCTMAHGVESRAPFLAHDLITYAFALPESAKLRGKSGKWALKQAARELLPPSILSRRKQGFSPPFSTWARGPLRGFVTDRLSRERVARAGVLDPATVESVVQAHLEGRAERGRTLWTLLSLQMWAERWLGSASLAQPATAGVAEAALVSR